MRMEEGPKVRGTYSDRGLHVDNAPHLDVMEQAVLGCLIEAPDKAEVVFGKISPDDFGPRTAVIAETLHSMIREGQPISAELILHRLRSEGKIRSEHAVLVSDCLAHGYTSGHVLAEYVNAMADVYLGRRVATLGARVQYMIGNTDVFTVLQYMGDEIARLNMATEREGKESPITLTDILNEEVSDTDWLIPGLLPRSDRLMIVGGEGSGKAQAITTPILTTNGWTTLEKIQPGDRVFHPDGSPVAVVAVTPVMHGRPCYRVTFSTGEEIVADAQHLWRTLDYEARQQPEPEGGVLTTEEMAASLYARGGHTLNHAIETTQPIMWPHVDLPVDPWLLGYWLGNGHSYSGVLHTGSGQGRSDHAVVKGRVRALGYEVGQNDLHDTKGVLNPLGLQAQLRDMLLLKDKRVPDVYLRSSVDQRLALLQGIMDADGSAARPRDDRRRGDPGGSYEITLTNCVLMDGVSELLTGLGILHTVRERVATLNGREIGPRWRATFRSHLPVFSLPRKAERMRVPQTRRYLRRYIVSVESVESVPVKCIEVATEDGMYLCGKGLIPTHNSVALRQFALSYALGLSPFTLEQIPEPGKALLIDCENSRAQVVRGLRGMYSYASRHTHAGSPDNLVVESRQRGIDLCEPYDQRWFRDLVRRSEAKVVCIGPLYRIASGDINVEETVRCWQRVMEPMLDNGISIVMEHHSPHGMAGQRELRPIGSSALRRWFSQGVALRVLTCDAHGTPYCRMCPRMADVEMWRGSRDETWWPAQVRSPGAEVWWTRVQRAGVV